MNFFHLPGDPNEKTSRIHRSFSWLNSLRYQLSRDQNGSRRHKRLRRSTAIVAVSERLEQKSLLSAVTWDGGAGNFSWNSPLNWSGDVLPTAVDDVSINTVGITVTLAGAASVQSLQSNANLTVSSGALTVKASSNVNGDLTLTSSTITADGGTAEFFANGTAIVTSSNLFAINGGQLSLLGPASHNALSVATTIRASGVGSTIDLSGCTTTKPIVITNDSQYQPLKTIGID